MKKIKKAIFYISLFLSIFFIVTAFYNNSVYDYCISEGHCVFWLDIINSALPILLFLFSIVVLIFSSVTYFLKEDIFRFWIKFTYYWIPISMLLVLAIPSNSSGGFFPSLIDKESVAILMSGLFCIISFIIIIVMFVKNCFKEKFD
jgi:hypothetical protein